MNTTLDPRVKDQISIYVAEAIEQGVKFETSNHGDWCRELTVKIWNVWTSDWLPVLWVSVYIGQDTDRLKVEAKTLGYNGHKVAKRDVVDYIAKFKHLEESMNSRVA